MAQHLVDYIASQKKKLAVAKADEFANIFRITWKNAHEFFGREDEVECPAVCEICPPNGKSGRQPDLSHSDVARRHLTGADHLNALQRRAAELQARNKGMASPRGSYEFKQRSPSDHSSGWATKFFIPCPLYRCQGKAAYMKGDKKAVCNVCNSEVITPR